MPNRLSNESSPYLLQHAENPVDWYPWGEEAMRRAQNEDKPILLSIGYSSCHWCHVMAHESFEDAQTAAYMNEHFVNIKVDREERPDIDAIYMEAVQAMTGHGGWPLTAFLTPSQSPFFAGTYFPPQPRPNMPSFRQVMQSIIETWSTRRDEIEESREKMVEALSTTARLKAPAEDLSPETLSSAREGLLAAYDPVFGGFGGAPKFPIASAIDFLLAGDDASGRDAALDTLRKMAAGGIYDQIGGGFSRYSVDERWHIPHFEKMLYDNALLARSYLHGFQVAGEEHFARITRETLDWMIKELRGDDGGFASSLDADSLDEHDHLEEGAFYAWELDEVRELAGNWADDIATYWGVIDHGEFEGKNVLFVNAPERKPPEEEFQRIRAAMYERRARRPWPGRDDKRIAAWNALAISALAEAGSVLGEPRYIAAAVAAAEFVERELRRDDSRLLRSRLPGATGEPYDGYLEDHAYVTAAYLTLYEATFDERWFVAARTTAELVLEHFADGGGGFFTTADDHEELLVRRKDIEDTPIPSGNASMALALLRLSALTGEQRYREAAADTLRILQKMAARFPSALGHALQAIDFYLAPVKEVALVGENVDELRHVVHGEYRPHIVLAGGGQGDHAVPLLEGRAAENGDAVAYVCSQFACKSPTSDPAMLSRLLEQSA
ncbi:MAG TPA: thioredoxin domain-containing protein [Solirubrobacterales bacterium]|nr:thioredoxin domain-containing protein [Solirubrobacterales bacterium]